MENINSKSLRPTSASRLTKPLLQNESKLMRQTRPSSAAAAVRPRSATHGAAKVSTSSKRGIELRLGLPLEPVISRPLVNRQTVLEKREEFQRKLATSSSVNSSPSSPTRGGSRPSSASSLRLHGTGTTRSLSSSHSSSSGFSRPVSAPSLRMQRNNFDGTQIRKARALVQLQEGLVQHTHSVMDIDAMAQKAREWLDSLPAEEQGAAIEETQQWVKSEGMDWVFFWQKCRPSQEAASPKESKNKMQVPSSPQWRIVASPTGAQQYLPLSASGGQLEGAGAISAKRQKHVRATQAPLARVDLSLSMPKEPCVDVDDEMHQHALEAITWLKKIQGDDKRAEAFSEMQQWVEEMDLDWNTWWNYLCYLQDSAEKVERQINSKADFSWMNYHTNQLKRAAHERALGQENLSFALNHRRLEGVYERRNSAGARGKRSGPRYALQSMDVKQALGENDRSRLGAEVMEKYDFDEDEFADIDEEFLEEAWLGLQAMGRVEDVLDNERKERWRMNVKDYVREAFPMSHRCPKCQTTNSVICSCIRR